MSTDNETDEFHLPDTGDSFICCTVRWASALGSNGANRRRTPNARAPKPQAPFQDTATPPPDTLLPCRRALPPRAFKSRGQPIVYKPEVFQTITEIRCIVVSLIHSLLTSIGLALLPGLRSFLPRVPRGLLGIGLTYFRTHLIPYARPPEQLFHRLLTCMIESLLFDF